MTALLQTLKSLIEQRLNVVAKDIFMDVERIITELEESTKQQHHTLLQIHPAEEPQSADVSEVTASKVRVLRSSSDYAGLPRRAPHLLPVACLICKKNQYIVDSRRKRMMEKLSKCQTINAGKLQHAAEEKMDETLLIQIRGIDLVAAEAMYHMSCYRRYTKYLSNPKRGEEENPGINPYQAGYTEFCKTVVEERLQRRRDVLRLSYLNNLFKNIVRETEGLDISTYKGISLKARLQKSHPFLKFLKSAKNTFVYIEDLTADEVIHDEAFHDEAGPPSSEDDEDDATEEWHQRRDDPAIPDLPLLSVCKVEEPEPPHEEAEPPQMKMEEHEELLLRPEEADGLTLTLSHWNHNLDTLSVSVSPKTLSHNDVHCSSKSPIEMLEASNVIRARVLSALPSLPVDVLGRVVEWLIDYGAETEEDLHSLTEEDLEGLMTPIQCRKLLKTMSHPDNDKMLEASNVIRARVLSVLPSLPVEVLGRVVERLMEHGVETEEDLHIVTEEDLEGLMTPLQCRQLQNALKHAEPESMSGPPRPDMDQSVPLDQSASVSTSSPTSSPPASPTRWPEYFYVKWDKLPPSLRTALRNGKRLSPVDTWHMVRVIVNDMQRMKSVNPLHAECIVRIIVAQYPQSFAHDSLLTQIKARIDHVNRKNPLARHRKRKNQAKPPGGPPDTYGCTQWQPELPPTEETKESLEDKRRTLTDLFYGPEWYGTESTDVIKLMETTYSLQRQMINADPAPRLSDVKQQWPYLFFPSSMCAHFERLTDVPILREFGAFLQERGRIIMEFFTRNPTNDAVKAVLNTTECSVTAANILQLLMAHFEEPLDALVIQTDESASPLADTPRLIVAGPMNESNQLWRMSIQKQVLCEGESFLVGLAVLFSSYYNFNLQYQHDAACTLEFIQRCCIGVWPERCTKASQEMMVQNKTSVNPHVSALMEKLSNNSELYPGLNPF